MSFGVCDLNPKNGLNQPNNRHKKTDISRFIVICEVVPVGGLEPPLPKKPDFESSVSTNSTTLASQILGDCFNQSSRGRHYSHRGFACKYFVNYPDSLPTF
jgi:hypothetical protein